VLVGVCDFPSSYGFPPTGYGRIERWLWAVAIGARATGADVHLLGPGWRRDLGADWTRKPLRQEDTVPGSLAARELRSAGCKLACPGSGTTGLDAAEITEAIGRSVPQLRVFDGRLVSR
jgi:hypothetical protein